MKMSSPLLLLACFHLVAYLVGLTNPSTFDGRYSSSSHHVLYVDERGRPEQQRALADIFLGRAGGTTLRNFARAIGEVYAVRPAQIELHHVPDQERIAVEHYVTAKTARPVSSDAPVSCGISGHDRPGQEIIAEGFQVDDGSLHWTISGRCGFATSFAYSSDQS